MDTKYLEIIKAPLVTEKSSDRKTLNQYTFKVSPKASKIRTLNMKVKKKRVGRYTGLSNRCKKAIVTLKPGQTIELN